MNSLLNPLNLDQRRAIIATTYELTNYDIHEFIDTLTKVGIIKTEQHILEAIWDALYQIEDLRNGADPAMYADPAWNGPGDLRDHLINEAEREFDTLTAELKFDAAAL